MQDEQKDCGLLLKQIHDELEKNANNALRSQDLTITQLSALEKLFQAPDGQMSLKDLEKKLHVAQSTTAGIISRLERKDLVHALADPEDRRVKLLQITDEGVERVRRSMAHRLEVEERLLSGLTETEQSIFCTLLKKVRDSLQ